MSNNFIEVITSLSKYTVQCGDSINLCERDKICKGLWTEAQRDGPRAAQQTSHPNL